MVRSFQSASQRDVRVGLIRSNAHNGACFPYRALDIVRLQQRVREVDACIHERRLHAKRGLELRNRGSRIVLRQHDQTERIGGLGIARIFANRCREGGARGGKIAALQSRGSFRKCFAVFRRTCGRRGLLCGEQKRKEQQRKQAKQAFAVHCAGA